MPGLGVGRRVVAMGLVLARGVGRGGGDRAVGGRTH